MSDALNNLAKNIDRSPAEDMDFEQYVKAQGYEIPEQEPEKVKFEEADVQAAQVPKEQKAASEGGTNMGKDVGDVVKAIWNGAVDIADGAENVAADFGLGSGDIITETSHRFEGDSTVHRVTRGIVRYGAPALATLGVGAGPLTAMAVGAGIDAVVLDPHQERLSSMILEEAPELKNYAVVGNTLEYLQNKPGEGNLQGRFKNVVEGALISMGVIAGAKGLAKIFTSGQKVSKDAKALLDSKKAIPIKSEAEVAEAEAKMGANATTPAPTPPDFAHSREDLPKVKKILDDEMKRVTKEHSDMVAKRDALPAGATERKFFDKQLDRINVEMNSVIKSHEVFVQKANKYYPGALDEVSPPPNQKLIDYLTQFTKENPQGVTAHSPGGVEDVDVQNFMGNPEQMDSLLKWKAGDRPLTDIEVKVTHRLMDESYKGVMEAAEKAIASGDESSLAQFSQMLDVFKYVDNVRTGTGSAAGAALNAHKIAEDISGMPYDEYIKSLGEDGKRKMLSDLLKLSGGKENLNQLAVRIKAIEEAGLPVDEALSAISRAGSFKKSMEIAQYVAINGMLSSPKTTMANLISNAFTTTNQVATNATAWVTGMLRRTPEGVTIAQQSAGVRAMLGSFMESLSAAGNALRGRPAGPADKLIKLEFQKANPISAQALNIPVERNLGFKIFGNIVDKTGMAVGLPTRMNSTSDAFFGTMNYRMSIAEQATAEAESLGLKGKEFKAHVANKISKPTVGMHEAAMARAQENTFSKALDPQSFTGAVDNAVDKFPLGRVVLPFFKTSANIIDYTIRHSPLAYFTEGFPTARQIISGAGGKEADIAIAKAVNGSMFLGISAYLASEGLITGPAPSNWRAKQAIEESGTGWQPDSIRVGDTYVAMNRIDPMVSVMRLGAVLANLNNYVEAEEYEGLAATLGIAVADFLTPEMMVDSLSRTMEAYNEASKYDGDGEKIAAVLSDFASRFTPYGALQRDIKNELDPFKGSAMVTKDASWLDNITDRIINRYKTISPWLSEDLPIQRNMFGEPLMVPAGVGPDMISPFAESKGSNSRLVQQLQGLSNYFGEFSPTNPDLIPLTLDLPGKTVTFKGVNVELTPAEHERLIMYSAGLDANGNGPKGGSLREVLTQVVEPIWKEIEGKEMSPRVYNKLVGSISGIIRKYREFGKAQLFSEPGFQERWNRKLQRTLETQEVTPNSQLGL